jgi:hypothetical protein
MSETSKHLNPDDGDPFESALSERLLRRATEPLGVIDVRYAEEKYFRIVRWLGRCTALLDHLRRRYGIEQATPYGDRPFAIGRGGAHLNISNTIQAFLSAGLSANLSSGSLSGAESGTNALQSSARETRQEIQQQQIQREAWKDVRPSGLADLLAERSTNAVVKPSSSSEGTFRISRRPPPRLPGSHAPQTSRPAATPTKDAEGDWDGTRSEQVTQQMPFRNKVNEEETANVARPTNARELDGPPVTLPTSKERGGPTSSIVQRDTPGGSKAQEPTAGNAAKNQREDASASSSLHSLPLVTPTIGRQRTKSVTSPPQGAEPRTRFDDVTAQDGSRSQASSASIIPSRTEAFESRDESSNAEKPELVLRRGDRGTDDASPATSLPGRVQKPPDVSRAAIVSEIPGESVSTDRLDLVLREHEAASGAEGSGTQESSSGAPLTPVEFAPSMKRDMKRAKQTDSPSRDESSNAEKPNLVLRRGDRETDVASRATALPGSVKAPRGVSRAAVASEIPGESVNTDRLDLVFREHEAASRADGSGAQETPPSESSNSAISSPVELAPSTKRDAKTDFPASNQVRAREMQVEDISPRVIRSISERVMRAITLDLKLERERRGVTKWR